MPASHVLAALLAATLLVAPQQTQPGLAQQFEEAVTLMDAAADYAAAGRLFAQVGEGSDRPLAARALVYLAHCLERLGDPGASAVYRRVIEAFADQPAAVADARARLNLMGRAGGASRGAMATLRPLYERLPALSRSVGRASYDGRFLPLLDGEGHLMLQELATLRVGPLVPIGKAGGLPECWPEPPPTLSPDGSQVAFTCQPEGSETYELRIVRTDGDRAAARRVLNAPAGELVGALDWNVPDTLLAQFRAPDGATRLATVSTSGVVGTVVHVAGPVEKASLSPNGRWMVFDGPTAPSSADVDIFIASVADGVPRALVAGPFRDTTPMWAPDGRGIVFVSDRTGTTALWYQPVVNGRAAGAERLLFPGLGRMAGVMALTRAGQFLYFRETGLVDVYVVDLGPEALPVSPPANASTHRVGQNLMPAWSPDGARLAYVSRERGIVVRDMADGAERGLAAGLSGVTWPRWSPDGRTILVRGTDERARYGLYRVDAASGDVSALKLVPGADESFLSFGRWTRDGRAVVFAFAKKLIRLDVETGAERVLHTFGADTMARFGDVSPVDDSILLALRERSSATMSLAVLSPQGALRQLLESRPGERFDLPVWLPDARGVVFSRGTPDAALPPEARRPTLWRLDLASSDVRPLGIALDGARDPAVSADGRRLAFTAGFPTREPWVLEHFLPPPAARPQVRR